MSVPLLLAMVNRAREVCTFPTHGLPARADVQRTRKNSLRALVFILLVVLPILAVVYWLFHPTPSVPSP